MTKETIKVGRPKYAPTDLQIGALFLMFGSFLFIVAIFMSLYNKYDKTDQAAKLYKLRWTLYIAFVLYLEAVDFYT